MYDRFTKECNIQVRLNFNYIVSDTDLKKKTKTKNMFYRNILVIIYL